ncbi:hypothetical protein NLJ89_g4157 [Agrocybe chaxingu]|uniref:Uncharacterized protein n=1 Tax=Agrocybe chaxingu TaxID=84603 RepID=A0A9W8K2N4_9AGAR|nr:hypothetical protein NLJ89_g4157 [Agrocybe chaxingu]
MPEYVYALHDFAPEHEDEVSFRAGERLEVIEKDDQFGDGWWQGRNLAGKVGLFPVSYTAPAPPAASASTSVDTSATAAATSKSVLQPLHEENESDSPKIVSPVPKAPPAQFLNGDGYESDLAHGEDTSLRLASGVDGEVMKATMTDVQKAIEQLGRGDFDLSDIDAATDDANGEDWHKNARRKLAAKARRAVEEAEKLEAMMSGDDKGSIRREVAPPIEVELSDESDAEDEDNFTRSSKFHRHHSYIPEEDETELLEEAQESKEVLNKDVVVPPRDETEMPTATAATLSFPVFSPPSTATESQPIAVEAVQRAASPVKPRSPVAAVFTTPSEPAAPVAGSTEQKRGSVPSQQPVNGQTLPSIVHPNGQHSKHDSIVSSSSAPAMTMPTPIPAPTIITMPVPQPAPLPGLLSPVSDLRKTHPSEWSLEQVIEWLKAKGFDQDVCDKFTEQEITGDVLLELDVNLLKSEIGIMAFGKRMRIANAIADLRRPPSIEFSDHHASEHPSPLQMQHSTSNTHTHSRTQSQSHSHHSFPGAGHGYSQSVQSSLGSPMGYGGSGNGTAYGGSPFGTVQESPATTQTTKSDGKGDGVASAIAAAGGVGLGIAMSPNALSPSGKGRPVQLQLSPSDGALKDSAARSIVAVSGGLEDEDRGHMSEGEIAPTATSMRRRLFGRSHDSAGSIINSSSKSKDSPAASPTVRDTPDKDLKDKDSTKDSTKGSTKEKDKDSAKDTEATVGRRHARAKKSMDAGRHGDRMSIFGGTFVGTLGKSRKPPPSSITSSDDTYVEKSSSKFSLPRLHGPSMSMRKSSSNSHRPSTPSDSPKDVVLNDSSPKQEKKDHSTLRKRTSSNVNATAAAAAGANAAVESVNGVSGPIKQGQSILEQIGEADHTGWMRKRGERYNTWKMRYFVLKGPHLYWLKSSSKAETRIKGYIHIVGYKVTVDENVDPGRYGFRIDHDSDKTHYFSSEEKTVIREWMKAIMKATIGRDYTKPVVSSCNIPTIPLIVAQAMNPAPRPPSPTARDATQRALRRENPGELSSRDARVLMGLSGSEAKDDRSRLDSFFSSESSTVGDALPPTPRRTSAPPRPSREMRRTSSIRTATNSGDDALIDWANSHLPEHLQINDATGYLCGGLTLLRLAESIRGRPSSPPIPDSAFPVDSNDDKLDGLFRLFDFLLDNDVKMGSVSINDVRQGKRDKIIQLLRALRAWEEKRRALANTIAKASSPTSYMVPMVVS